MAQFEIPTPEHGPVIVDIPTLTHDAPPDAVTAAATPLLAQGKFQKSGSAPSGVDLTWQQKAVRGAAPSIIGGAAGAAAGAFTAPVTFGLANPVTMGMAGAGLGEWINQRFLPDWSGATPSKFNIGLAAAGPALAPALGAMAKTLPGVEYSLQSVMQQTLGPNGQKVIAAFTPKRDEVKAAWDAVHAAGQGLTVTPTAVKATLTSVRDELNKSSFTNAASRKLLAQIEKMAGAGDDIRMVPLDEFRATMSDLGATIGALERSGGKQLGRAKQLYGAFWDDFTRMSAETGGEVGDKLRTAVLGTKLETAAEMLKEWFTKSASYVGSVRQMNIPGVLTKIDRNREQMVKLLGESDVARMMAFLKDEIAPTLERSGGGTPLSQMLNWAPGLFVRFLSTEVGQGIVRSLMHAGPATTAAAQIGRTMLFPPQPHAGPSPMSLGQLGPQGMPPITLAPSPVAHP